MKNPVHFCLYCLRAYTESASAVAAPQITNQKISDQNILKKDNPILKENRIIKDIKILTEGRCPFCGRSASEYVPLPRQLPPGTILQERYLLGAVLGEGGHGITYIGYDLILEIRVAVKEYFPIEHCTRNVSAGLEVNPLTGVQTRYYERGMEKYLSEARILAKMEKQQVIVGVRDFFEENNTAYIVMEYIEGDTFTDIVEKQGGRIQQEDLFRILKPLFTALDALHQKNILHRDICPDNLMLEKSDVQETADSASASLLFTDNKRIRLLDFGCARDTFSIKNTLTLTLRHGYSPIEQYQQGGGQGPWTDVYELCATIYYCLTGLTPPIATNRITEDTLLPPSRLGIELPPYRERAIMKGLRIRPHQRFADMKALMEAFYKE